jgi:pimeloyl-ACP methyl ester carboxylesterase
MASREGLKRVLLVGLMISAVPAALVVIVFSFQRSVLFPRPPVPSGTPHLPAGAEVLWLEGVEAWYLPPPASSKPAPALIFSHGNGELMDNWLGLMQTPQAWGFGVLLVEYPGYGRSAGDPSEQSLRAAMSAAFDALAVRPEIDAHRIVAYGRSLGGGAACLLSRDRPLAALILESSFTSIRAMARRLGVPGLLVRDPFDNLDALRAYAGPALILHGARDEVVPFSEGQQLAQVEGAELSIMACGHNDCPRPWPAIMGFLTSHGLFAGSTD